MKPDTKVNQAIVEDFIRYYHSLSLHLLKQIECPLHVVIIANFSTRASVLRLDSFNERAVSEVVCLHMVLVHFLE